jgi:hypothetical protein
MGIAHLGFDKESHMTRHVTKTGYFNKCTFSSILLLKPFHLFEILERSSEIRPPGHPHPQKALPKNMALIPKTIQNG